MTSRTSNMTSRTLLVLLKVILVIESGEGTGGDFSRVCEPIRIDSCRGVGYNKTGMPNSIGHELQQDAELQFQTFVPLIQYGCSSQLKFFLCSVYVPMCNEKVPENILPCRPLCESVRKRCQPVLLEFGFMWPPALDCDRFPSENNQRHMCMEGPGESDLYPPSSIKPIVSRPTLPKTSSNPSSPESFNPESFKPETFNPESFKPETLKPPGIVYGEESEVLRPTGRPSGRVKSQNKKNGLCSKYKLSSEYVYIDRTSSCGHRCSADILFSKENKSFSEVWLLIWSSICCLLTAFTMITFILDSNQFQYPERVIVILASTFFMYSLGSIIRVAFGRESVACHIESQHGLNLLIQEGPDNFKCTIVFVILYYFWMTSMVWWVNLTVMWFLASGLKWSSEAIEKKSSYFHIIAWILPGLKTLAILIMRVVDADELTGTCFVGNHNNSTLMAFLILPSSIYITIGVIFLLIRWYYMFVSTSQEGTRSKTRHRATPSAGVLSNCCNPRGSQELLHLRISFFTYFYLLPSICLLATNVYEYYYRDSWYQSFQGSSGHYGNGNGNGNVSRPNVEVFTLKVFFQLIPGILSGLWIWSSLAPVAMWRRTFCRVDKPSSAASFGTMNKQPIPPVSAYFMPLSTPSSFHGSFLFPPCPVSSAAHSAVPSAVPSAAPSTLSRELVAAHNTAQQQVLFVSTMDRRSCRMYGGTKGGETTV